MEKKFADYTQEQAVAQLAKVTQELENFTYIVSHDLQAPLRSVVNFSRLLQERYDGMFDEKGNKYFNYVTNGAEQMQKMVEGLLRYSRIATQAGESSKWPLYDIVGQAHVSLKEKINQSKAVVRISEGLPEVFCEPKQIADVFYILIDNAIKFQPEGRHPEIWVDAQKQEDGHYVILVKDNGIGIDPSRYEDVFHIFRQLNKPTEYPGLGIGLALAKKIIERHGGAMWVESKVGEESTFFFTIAGGDDE